MGTARLQNPGLKSFDFPKSRHLSILPNKKKNFSLFPHSSKKPHSVTVPFNTQQWLRFPPLSRSGMFVASFFAEKVPTISTQEKMKPSQGGCRAYASMDHFPIIATMGQSVGGLFHRFCGNRVEQPSSTGRSDKPAYPLYSIGRAYSRRHA